MTTRDSTVNNPVAILQRFSALQKSAIIATPAITRNFPNGMASTAPSPVLVAVATTGPVDDVERVASGEDNVSPVFVTLAVDGADVLSASGAAVAAP